MSSLRAPGLRIEPAPDGKSLVIYDREEGKHLIPCRLSDTYAAEYRKTLKRGLDRLKALVSKGAPTLEDAHAALGELNRVGLTLVWQIFGEQRELIVGLFQRTFPFWQSASKPLLISLVAELGRFLPIEFLPLFELSDWPPVDDTAMLVAAARRFPGLSAVTRREFPDLSINQDLVLENEPKLPMKCFSFTGLGGASEEIRFFDSHQDCIDLEGPWPTGPMKARDFSRLLARHLRYSDERFNGIHRPECDQVQHFACHCEIDEEVSSNSRLRLSFDNEATIADLQADFALLEDRRGQSRPLIFLNACGSSRMEPMMVTSFPRFFLQENRNRGFIGTEINIPDAFAASFSREFYAALLKGVSVGEAIYAARWTMIKDHNNPLGILYTVYADPDLRVKTPHKDSAA
jgi:hypothetical protein